LGVSRPVAADSLAWEGGITETSRNAHPAHDQETGRRGGLGAASEPQSLPHPIVHKAGSTILVVICPLG